MNRRTWIVIGLALVLAGMPVLAQPAAPAAPGCADCRQEGMVPGQGKGKGMGLGRGMRGLALTEEQYQKLDELRIGHLKETMPVETDIQIKDMELEALWRAEKLDGKKIVAKVREISALREKLDVARVNNRLALYNLMTPEQREKARAFMGRIGGGMGRRGMRGHGTGRGMRGMGQGNGPGRGPMGAGCGCDKHEGHTSD